MRQFQDHEHKTLLETMRGSLLMLAFGLGMLAFLVAIDRPEWFNLRPASGTASAMSKAAHVHGTTDRTDREPAGRDADISVAP